MFRKASTALLILATPAPASLPRPLTKPEETAEIVVLGSATSPWAKAPAPTTAFGIQAAPALTEVITTLPRSVTFLAMPDQLRFRKMLARSLPRPLTPAQAPLAIAAVADLIELTRSPSLSARVLGNSTPTSDSSSSPMLLLPWAKSTISLTARTTFRANAIRPSGPPTKIATTVISRTIQKKASQNCSQALLAHGLVACATESTAEDAVPAAASRSDLACSACCFRVSRRESSSARPWAWESALSAEAWASRSFWA
ncbi:hypothetical protein Kisp01_46750 [Kineosporia sp. NBRC 101677]|nr:hypothetical protein Kisp01_46750 [Kineosporia sp. NBRC 101677]